MKPYPIVIACALLWSQARAQDLQKPVPDTIPVKSVVIRQHPAPDSLTAPVVKPRKWRPRIAIVPATSPGGRSRQEILYSDSLEHNQPEGH